MAAPAQDEADRRASATVWQAEANVRAAQEAQAQATGELEVALAAAAARCEEELQVCRGPRPRGALGRC
jgi:hypothetical protein